MGYRIQKPASATGCAGEVFGFRLLAGWLKARLAIALILHCSSCGKLGNEHTQWGGVMFYGARSAIHDDFRDSLPCTAKVNGSHGASSDRTYFTGTA